MKCELFLIQCFMFSYWRYGRKSSVLRAIGRALYPRGGTYTGRALSYTKRALFARSRRRKVLIVVTDGRSFDKVLAPAVSLRKSGVDIISIGVGRGYAVSQLRQISGNNRRVFTAGFRSMGTLARLIKNKACKGEVLVGGFFCSFNLSLP